jgi:hypothetical protein
MGRIFCNTETFGNTETQRAQREKQEEEKQEEEE